MSETAASKYASDPPLKVSNSDIPVASRIASEIGTSMLSRLAPSAARALAKNGCAAKATVGKAIRAEIRWKKSRVTSAAPDQTATESSIRFIIAKPDTPSRIRSAFAPASASTGASIAASSSSAGQPARVTASASAAASTPAPASMTTRFSDRLTRAERTPGTA